MASVRIYITTPTVEVEVLEEIPDTIADTSGLTVALGHAAERAQAFIEAI